jgi:hypothetical protein
MWDDLFANPIMWYDYREAKDKGDAAPNHPCFKHTLTEEALWLDGQYGPCKIASVIKRFKTHANDPTFLFAVPLEFQTSPKRSRDQQEG